MEKMQRIDWVDNAKAIAIFFVVLGHFSKLPYFPKYVIYSFHLPLFLMVTGFLLAPSFKDDIAAFCRKYVLPYLRLYVFFSIISIVLWYILEHRGENIFSIFSLGISGMLYGVGGKERLLMHNNDPLWYLPFLIATLLLTHAAIKYPLRLCIAALLMFAAFTVLPPVSRLPWCIDIAILGGFFIIAGIFYHDHYERLQNIPRSRIALLVLPLLAGAFYYLVALNGSTNINREIFGNNGLLYLFNALLGIAIIVIFSTHLPVTGLARSLSRHTIVIFCTHIYLVKAFNRFPYPSSDIATLFVTVFYAAIVTGACLLVSIAIDPALKRYILRKS